MLVTIFAGNETSGFLDGEASAARFHTPYAIRADRSGNVIVADSGNQCLRKVSSAGAVSTLAAVGCAITDLAVGDDGCLYVAYGCEIMCIRPEGGVTPFPFKAHPTCIIVAIALLHSGNLAVGTSAHHIYTVTLDGEWSLLAGSERGCLDGPGPQAKFNGLGGMAVDASGHIIVADTGNCRIRKVTPDGSVCTLAGGSQGSASQLDAPIDVAIDGDGTILIADRDARAVLMLPPQGAVTTLPLDPGKWDECSPQGLCVDADGAVVVAYEYKSFLCKVHSALKAPLRRASVPAHASLRGDLAGLLESGLMADVTFAVGSEEIPGHRALLASRSEYFAKLLTSEFKEAADPRIEVPDATPAAFRAVLRYLYTGVALEMEDQPAIDVLQLAQQYQILALYDAVRRQCMRRLDLKTAIPLLIQTHVHHLDDLHRACLRYVAKNYKAIRSAARQSIGLLTEYPSLMQQVMLELE